MATKKHNAPVTLAREEYDAFLAREEVITKALADKAKLTNQLADAAQLIDAQSTRMTLMMTRCDRLEQLVTLRREHTAEHGYVVEVSVKHHVDPATGREKRDERMTTLASVVKALEALPDVGKVSLFQGVGPISIDTPDRADTREMHDEKMPITQQHYQSNMIRKLMEENAKLKNQLDEERSKMVVVAKDSK
jgi:hypothetical protein